MREVGGAPYPGKAASTSLTAAFVKPGDRYQDVRTHAAAVASLGRPSELPLGRTLLAEAGHLASYTMIPHASRALLMAAVACEVHVKAALRTAAAAEQAPLVDLLLENPRDWTLAAAGMFDKLADATAGRSLRKEAPETYKAVVALFEARNRLAHRGEIPTRAEARAHVAAAEAAFQWLDTLHP